MSTPEECPRPTDAWSNDLLAEFGENRAKVPQNQAWQRQLIVFGAPAAKRAPIGGEKKWRTIDFLPEPPIALTLCHGHTVLYHLIGCCEDSNSRQPMNVREQLRTRTDGDECIAKLVLSTIGYQCKTTTNSFPACWTWNGSHLKSLTAFYQSGFC